MHRSEVTIGRSADEVWATIRDFGDLRWYPHVERCEVEGDDRTTWKVGSDLASVERIVEHDDASRSCSYVLVDFVGPAVVAREGGRSYDARNLIGHHRAALAVTPTGEKRCRVTYDVTVEGDDEMTRSIGRGYGEALTHLQSTLESQDHDA